MCKGSVQYELPDHKRFQNLYWAIKNHETFPEKFKNPRKIYPSALWNQWVQDADLRNYVANTVEYDCFWRKYKREMLFRVINDSYWIIRPNDFYEEEGDIFDLNYLFFENDGDIWKTYDETLGDLLDLNLLFRNFSIRPECDDNCCESDYGPFQSDYDLCHLCWCCKYLHKFYDQRNETAQHQFCIKI